MNDNLIKEGLLHLAAHDEATFKANINALLDQKKAQITEEIGRVFQKDLFLTAPSVNDSDDRKQFDAFVENFVPGKYRFENNSSINITEEDMANITDLLESLNHENQDIMIRKILTDGKEFKQHLEFYDQVKGLINEE